MIDLLVHKQSIKVPTEQNELLAQVVEKINNHEELAVLWKVNNINAIDRLGYSDHGYTHFQIVANSALRIARLFHRANIEMSVMTNYELPYEYAEVVLLLAAVMHDIGMSINREGHEELSLFLARDIIKNLLDFLPLQERVVIQSEVLHAILSHRADGKPITIEAGILRIADALDLTAGRSRIPFEAGKINIHSISAYAIEKVDITEGKTKPVEIAILMNNSSGLFQVDELLKKKLRNSGISKYLAIRAYTDQDTEKNLVKEFIVEE